MVTAVQRWGNSLALRIPAAFAHETHIRAGSSVDIVLKNGTLVVKPMKAKRKNLKELVAGIAPSNLHGEVSTGQKVGNEVW